MYIRRERELCGDDAGERAKQKNFDDVLEQGKKNSKRPIEEGGRRSYVLQSRFVWSGV